MSAWKSWDKLGALAELKAPNILDRGPLAQFHLIGAKPLEHPSAALIYVLMRTLILAAVLALAAPTAAFAYCPVIADADTAAQSDANQQAVIACQHAELNSAARLQQQQLDLQAALQAQQRNFELQQRMQQTFEAAQPPVTFPTF
jgi:hypothetical protein